jgi:exopolysaccharide biosynthesis polyprenyl glycosylphosphotransferase
VTTENQLRFSSTQPLGELSEGDSGNASLAQASVAAPPRLAPESWTAQPLIDENRRALRIALYLVLLLADVGSIFGSFAFGSLVRYGNLANHDWLQISLAVLPLFVISALHNGAYSLPAMRSPWGGAERALSALLGSFAILFVVSYFLRAEQDVSRAAVGTGGIVSLVALPIVRRKLANWLMQWARGRLMATIIIADETFVPKGRGAMVIDPAQRAIRPEPRNPAMIQRFVQLVDSADRVIVACSGEACSGWAAMLKSANVRGEIFASEAQSVGAVGIGRFGSRRTFVVSSGPLTTSQRIIKRAFDIVVAIVILVLAAPLLIGIAIAIKLDSPGPVIFRQKRVGFGNRFFDMYKFRSMAVHASDPLGVRSTAVDDDRLTRVGRFIRKTSLDELPQLFNVLSGSMSLVGPRPHAIGSLAGPVLFWDVDDRYAHRHLLKPGITGLAQIRGLRGTAVEVDDLSRRLQSDLEYMNGWSVWRDLVIIIKTCRVIAHPNAY